MKGCNTVSLVFFVNFMFCEMAVAQPNRDTLHIASSNYVLFHRDAPIRLYSAGIKDDSTLVIYDSTGALMDFRIAEWTLAMVIDSNYVDQKIHSNTVPENVLKLLNNQPKGAWICIERIIAIRKNGDEIRIAGEKWVKT